MLVRKIVNLSSARLILHSCVKLIEIVTKKSKSPGGPVAAGQELCSHDQSTTVMSGGKANLAKLRP